MSSNASATDVSQLSDEVLRGLSWSSDCRTELVRRERVRQCERATKYLSDLVAEIRGMAVGVGSWAAIANLLCSSKVERRMREAQVSIAAVVEVSGLSVAALL